MTHITDHIRYIGVNDHRDILFESQYPVPNGMAYNSYVILDDKIAVMDSVDVHFTQPWLDNLAEALEGRQPDYLIVQHMEPDHSGSLAGFLQRYPNTTILSTNTALTLMHQFLGKDFNARHQVVNDGDTLSLGTHTLTFLAAPMVHWPEVMVTYDNHDKVLFSADAFGKFGALDAQENWADEARRYYIGIVGKYGFQVQRLLNRAKTLDIQIICPLHGPVLTENLSYYLNLYDIWSSYRPEQEGIVIAYTSVYGNTQQAVSHLAKLLREKGAPVVLLYDLSRCDLSQAVSDAFCYSKLVLATTTYNAGIFPPMHTFLHHLTQRDFQNRTIGLIENGSWFPHAAKTMRDLLSKSKNLIFTDTTVTLRSALTEENRTQLDTLANELCREYQ